MVEKPSKLQPALIGGAVAGIGMVAGSFIPFANFCCCLWPVVGGALAAWMLIRRSPVLPVSSGDGATTGVLAGLVGSVIDFLVMIPVMLFTWPKISEELNRQLENQSDPATRESARQIITFFQQNRILFALFICIVFALISVAFAALGGVIGVALFEKRKGQQPPPPYPPPPGDYPPPGFTPPGPPHGGPAPPPGQPPYGGGDAPPY